MLRVVGGRAGTAEGERDEDDVVVSDRPLVGLAFGAFNEALLDVATHGGQAARNRLALGGPRKVTAVREFLPEGEGEGYWDFFRLNDLLSVSITDAAYAKDRWISIEGGRFFKVRLLLSGRLLGSLGETLLQGPQAHLHVCPGEAGGGYSIARGARTQMVVLHCHPSLLGERVGLARQETPAPLDLLFSEAEERSAVQRIGMGPELVGAARKIVESRREMPSAVRAAYLEGLSLEILCQVAAELSNRELVSRTQTRLGARDLNAIYEARDYLSQHYAAPPTIPQLARLVGVNQTKLKALFKQALGQTVYDYVLQRRMEVAGELLAAGEHSVTEVAYLVGYEYPANFSCAFKRQYGMLPRTWKRA